MKRFTKLTSLIMALILLLCSMSFAVAETTEENEMRIVCMAPSMVECVYALLVRLDRLPRGCHHQRRLPALPVLL